MAKTQVIFIENESIGLNSRGIWLSDGIEIEHSETTRAFFRHLAKDTHGYFLKIGNETKRISVEDTAYFIRAIRGTPEKGYELYATDENVYPLEPKSLHYTESRLICEIETSIGKEKARFLSAAYWDLLKEMRMEGGRYTLCISGETIDLGPVSPPLKE